MASGYLDRLEINNFKSYRGKHNIGFLQFSAIIGPNGCGKSNMMDAISFVLGERTSELRVKKVNHLIHGAPIGKPVAKEASVTAFYIRKNDDGTQTNLTFCRKIKDNSTVYSINNKVVKNTEYQAELVKIGIHIKAKNFLVFQGAVEKIAMKNPKERTELFEEISGSGELAEAYAEKKKAMEKAEEDVTHALQKKKGINAEKKEAKAEKEEAEKYEKALRDLADAKLQCQLFKLYHTEQDIEKVRAEIVKDQEGNKVLENRRKVIDEDIKEKRSETAKLSRQVAEKEKRVMEKEEYLNAQRPLYLKAKQCTSHTLKKLEDANKALSKTKKQVEKQKNEIKETERQLEEVRQLKEQYQQELSQENEGQSLELMGTQMARYNQLKEEAGKQAAKVQVKLDEINRQQKSDEDSLQNVDQKKKELLRQQNVLAEERKREEERLVEGAEYIKTNKVKLEELRSEHRQKQEELRRGNTRNAEIQQELEEVQNELDSQKVDKHEASRQEKRAELIDNLRRLYPGVYGRLIDLCEPVHKKYTMAITKVLGKNMDGIVCDTEKTARECIDYMKGVRAKTETFLPLDNLKCRPTNDQFRNLGPRWKTAKLVIDVIKYDPPCIKKALQFSCGDSLVCDSLDEAQKLSFDDENNRKRTVSLDGTLFERSGVFSGGQSELKQKAKRWDTKGHGELKKRRDQLVQEAKEIQVSKRTESHLVDLNSQIQGLENRLKYTEANRKVTEDKLKGTLAKNQARMEKEIAEQEPEMKKYEEKINTRKEEIKRLQEEKNQVEDECFREFCIEIDVTNIREYEQKQLADQQAKTQKQLDFEKQEGRLQNQLDYIKDRDNTDQVKKLEKSIAKFEVEMKKLKEEEKEKLKVINAESDELDKFRGEKEVLKKTHDAKEEEVKQAKKLQSQITKEETEQQKKFQSKKNQLDQKISDRLSLLRQCKMEGVKLPLTQGTLTDITEEGSSQDSPDMDTDDTEGSSPRALRRKGLLINVNYSSLSDEEKELEDDKEKKQALNGLCQEVSDLEQAIGKIAAPNMKAGNKLDDVQNRLRDQNEEFESIRKKARKTKIEFEAIQKERYDKFTDAFEHVSNKIDDIYKELSDNKSAQAYLGMENQQEPYLEGISYNCIAPGKRFRPMDNLSGGEKTVAALALLFAIHSYQPSPFFVLDEIDAALDNTNINRVAKYIRNHAQSNFQCIVISLKEEFYTKADSLVGVSVEPDEECTTTKTLTINLLNYPE